MQCSSQQCFRLLRPESAHFYSGRRWSSQTQCGDPGQPEKGRIPVADSPSDIETFLRRLPKRAVPSDYCRCGGFAGLLRGTGFPVGRCAGFPPEPAAGFVPEPVDGFVPEPFDGWVLGRVEG